MQAIEELDKALEHLMKVTDGLGAKPLTNMKAIRYAMAAEKAVRRLRDLLQQEKEE